jgi:cellulose synthase/poly-beta-1,6-N-acetylglucosamine synthase-like glycosyltransferase
MGKRTGLHTILNHNLHKHTAIVQNITHKLFKIWNGCEVEETQGSRTRLSIINLAVILFLAFLYIWTVYNIPILAVGVWGLQVSSRKEIKRTQHPNKKKLPTFSIIVPAKDEEKVIGRLLKALLKLDYPSQKVEIVVVEDGSVDKTPEICKKYATQYPNRIKLLQQPESSGKPSALNLGLRHVNGKIVAVFDADNVPEPDMLRRVADYFKDSAIAAVQGRACSINAHENMLTKFISYEEAVRYETYLRGKDVLNLFVPLTGSCYFIRRSILEEIGGWDDEALSEDMEMAAKLTEKGYTIKYASNVRSWQENPTNLTQLFRQRTRWFRGSMEVSLKYGKLLRNPTKKNIDAEMTFSGPYMFIPCILGYFMGILFFIVPYRLDPLLMFMAQGLTLANTITLFLIAIALVYLTKPRKMTNLLWLPFVYAYWIVQNFVAFYALMLILLKRPKKWIKTVKTGVVAVEDNAIQTSV